VQVRALVEIFDRTHSLKEIWNPRG
jgi:hypothetical protein